jgi:hypothetical protein
MLKNTPKAFDIPCLALIKYLRVPKERIVQLPGLLTTADAKAGDAFF